MLDWRSPSQLPAGSIAQLVEQQQTCPSLAGRGWKRLELWKWHIYMVELQSTELWYMYVLFLQRGLKLSAVCAHFCYMAWDNVKITMLQARLDTMSNKSSYYWKNHNLDLSKVLCQCYIHRFKYQTKYNKFQLTIDLAHTSAIVSVSGLGPCTPLSVTAKAKDLEIWNISTKSSPAVKHSH